MKTLGRQARMTLRFPFQLLGLARFEILSTIPRQVVRRRTQDRYAYTPPRPAGSRKQSVRLRLRPPRNRTAKPSTADGSHIQVIVAPRPIIRPCRELLPRAFLQEPVDPGSGRRIVEAEQVGFGRDLSVQHVVGQQLEVEELAHVSLVGTAPPVVVDRGGEAGTSKQWRDVIEDSPQQGMYGVAITPGVVVVQFANQP